MSILLSADSEARYPASVLLDLIINRRINLVLDVLEYRNIKRNKDIEGIKNC